MGFINKLMQGATASLIAKKAASPEAFEGGVSITFTVPEMIEAFYRKYGSTEKKFEFHPKPGFYIGYVKLPDIDEFLCVIVKGNDSSVVASFMPEKDFGQDFVGLLAKAKFAEDVAFGFIQNSVEID
jgi:hypothetical protein